VHHIAFAPGTAYGEAALVPAFALDVLVLGVDTYALAPAFGYAPGRYESGSFQIYERSTDSRETASR